MMKKKGYSKGGMKKKGYAKGGMPMNPETGTPTFVGDGKGKMAGGGSAMKKKGYAKGGMKKKGYAKGGAAKKMHIGGATTVPTTQTVSGAGLQPRQAQAQMDLSNSYAQTIEPMRQAPAPLSPMQDLGKGAVGTTMPSVTRPTIPSSAMQDVGSKGAVGTTMPAAYAPYQRGDVGMGVGDVGVGDFMNSQRPQKLDINLGRQTTETSASAPRPLSPFKPALGKIGAMKKGGAAKMKKGGAAKMKAGRGGGSALRGNKKSRIF